MFRFHCDRLRYWSSLRLSLWFTDMFYVCQCGFVCVWVGGGGGGGLCVCVCVGGGGMHACVCACVCCKFVIGERAAGVLQRSTTFVCDYCVVRGTCWMLYKYEWSPWVTRFGPCWKARRSKFSGIIIIFVIFTVTTTVALRKTFCEGIPLQPRFSHTRAHAYSHSACPHIHTENPRIHTAHTHVLTQHEQHGNAEVCLSFSKLRI